MLEERTPDPIPRYSQSPRWSSTTKLVVAITMVAIVGGLLLRFRQIVGPLLVAFILAYLFYPLANSLRTNLRFSWRFSVTLLYLFVFVLLLGLLTLGGLATVEQVQNLIDFLTGWVQTLPEQVRELSAQPIQIWTYQIDLSEMNLQSVSNQIISVVQGLLTRTGTVVGTVAGSFFSFLGWTFFTLLVSYFVLADSGGIPERMLSVSIPGYDQDIKRMGAELGRIWNAFLRGQLIIMLFTISLYSALLGMLGVKFYFGLALLAGLARFIPYVGPAVAWTTYGLVAFFQGTTPFNMSPFAFAMLVVGLALLIDMVMDNYVTPRMMGNALQVHPAAVMVAAIISANLFGIIGVVLASPVLATIKLFGNYAIHKMMDQDPWIDIHHAEPRGPTPFNREMRPVFERIRIGFAFWWRRITSWFRERKTPSPK